MYIFRILLLLGLAATAFGKRIPLCRSNGQGTESEVCICSTESPTIVDRLDPQHEGLERLVIFVYRKRTGEIVIFTPDKKYQRRIPDIPENYGTIQNMAYTNNRPTIPEIFENSPSQDIRDNRPNPYYTSSENPEDDQQEPSYNGQQPDWQIPVTNPSSYKLKEIQAYPGNSPNWPGSNNPYQIPGSDKYLPIYTNGYPTPETIDYQTPGSNDYYTPETNAQIPGTVDYQTTDTNGYYTPEINEYQTPETNGYYEYPPDANVFQTPGTPNYQTPDTKYYYSPETNRYQPQGTNDFQRPETYFDNNQRPYNYQAPETNDFQEPETYNYPYPATNDYEAPETNYQIPGNHDYPMPGNNKYDTPKTYVSPLPHYYSPGDTTYPSSGSTEYVTPDTNKHFPYNIPENIEYIETPNDGPYDYRSKPYITTENENREPNPDDEDAASEKPVVTNIEYSPSDSDDSTHPVPRNSEEVDYPEPQNSNEGQPGDIEPSEYGGRPNNNPEDLPEEQFYGQDADIPLNPAMIRPIRNRYGRIIGWKRPNNKNYWKKVRHLPRFTDHDNVKKPKAKSFDYWLKQQLKVTTLSGSEIPTSTRDIIELHSAIQTVLSQNGFFITKRGTVTDGHGRATSLDNLKLRPIFIGKSFSFDSFIKQSTTNKIPRDSPYLQGLLLSMIKPAKILGIVPLKITSLPNKFGPKSHKGIRRHRPVGSKNVLKVIPFEDLSFRKDSRPKLTMAPKSHKSKDSTYLQQALANISRPRRPGQIEEPRDQGKPGMMSEEQPDFRIIGGISATVSGTPLLFKGRSGRE